MSTRRQILAGLAATGLLSGRAWADTATLRAGDQKGGTQSVMKGVGVLDGLPYRLLGWGEHRHDPAHANESWRMDEVFARARALPPQETSP